MTDETPYKQGTGEWSLDDYLGKLRPRRAESLSASFAVHSRLYLADQDVTDELLLESYTTMAQIVNMHGDRYLPIFERLHEEIENRAAKRKLLDTALKVADNAHQPPQ